MDPHYRYLSQILHKARHNFYTHTQGNLLSILNYKKITKLSFTCKPRKFLFVFSLFNFVVAVTRSIWAPLLQYDKLYTGVEHNYVILKNRTFNEANYAGDVILNLKPMKLSQYEAPLATVVSLRLSYSDTGCRLAGQQAQFWVDPHGGSLHTCACAASRYLFMFQKN